MTLFDFTPNADVSNWKIIDDVVMGGRSNGDFKLNAKGYGEFYGRISLENNGGFSSLRYNFKTKSSSDFSKFVLKIKGDGKNYQFRVKTNRSDDASYVFEFETTKEWMTIDIPFNKMQPQYRGRKLDRPNYPGKEMEEVTFLIGNKKEESFMLLIDWIKLE
jgi:hypothetical protein